MQREIGVSKSSKEITVVDNSQHRCYPELTPSHQSHSFIYGLSRTLSRAGELRAQVTVRHTLDVEHSLGDAVGGTLFNVSGRETRTMVVIAG